MQYVLLAVLVVSGAVFTFVYLEWERPRITIDRPFDAVGARKDVTVVLSDRRSGIRSYEVFFTQGQRRFVVDEGAFDSKGTLEKRLALVISPARLGMKDGEAVFSVRVTDYSPLRNRAVYSARVAVDSTPPRIALLSRAHNVNPGGTCLVVYRLSKQAASSGVTCAGGFFPGYPAGTDARRYYVCYFAVPRDMKASTPVAVRAADRAGNVSVASVPFYVRERPPFRRDTVGVSDAFLGRKAAEFQQMDTRCAGKAPEDVLSFVNSVLRAENDAKIRSVCTRSEAVRLWDGSTFLRMKNSAPKALFGDERTYVYQGRDLGSSVHLGVDLASLAQAGVEAANAGKVVFADLLGIYGNCVIMDHGQGVFSLYGHLSSISVKPGDRLSKGQTLGLSGATGFAGGDHLHFSILVSGVFVDPKEWWDPHWIRDNVTAKLDQAEHM
jgi:hypothetical protein